MVASYAGCNERMKAWLGSAPDRPIRAGTDRSQDAGIRKTLDTTGQPTEKSSNHFQ